MKKKWTLLLVALASVTLLAAACSSNSDSATPSTTAASAASMAPEQTIADIVTSNADFTTLAAAVSAAGLGDTLSGGGPFTVFAPTDAAFAALPAGTLDSLLMPKNKDKLTAILTYHVVPGQVMAADVTSGPVTTVNGQSFTVDAMGGTVSITDAQGNTAKVTATDIVASNGVIHVIDAVLLPA